MIVDFNKILTNLDALILQAELSAEQKIELAKFKNKTSNLFKDIDLGNITELEQKGKEIQEMAKNITNGLDSNK